MRISEIMTADVQLASPDDTIQQAASQMETLDAGVLPVGENDRLVGVVTDRDIAVRAVGHGMGPSTRVREVMTPEIMYCFDDQDLDEVLDNMGEIQVRRLPVVNREKRLVGIVSLGDVAFERVTDGMGETLSRISEPRGQHSQSA
jgi:CBS domain-containing protein